MPRNSYLFMKEIRIKNNAKGPPLTNKLTSKFISGLLARFYLILVWFQGWSILGKHIPQMPLQNILVRPLSSVKFKIENYKIKEF